MLLLFNRVKAVLVESQAAEAGRKSRQSLVIRTAPKLRGPGVALDIKHQAQSQVQDLRNRSGTDFPALVESAEGAEPVRGGCMRNRPPRVGPPRLPREFTFPYIILPNGTFFKFTQLCQGA